MVDLLREIYDRFPALEQRQLSTQVIEILSTERHLTRGLKLTTKSVLNSERLKEESIQLRLLAANKQVEFENRKILMMITE